MRTIILKILQTSSARIYSVLLGIITLSITARWLGPEGRGVVATITTWVIILAEVGEFSLSAALIFKASKSKGGVILSNAIAVLYAHTLIITVIGWLAVALLYSGERSGLLPGFFSEMPLIPLLIGLLILPAFLWDIFSKSLLNIEDKLNIYNRFQVIGSTANSLSIIILVIFFGLGVVGVLLSKLLWQVIIAWGGIKNLLHRKTHPLRFDPTLYKSLLSNGIKLHLNIIGAIMLTNIDIVMVNGYLGNEQTGIYQLAVQTSLMMMIIPYAVMTVLQGEITRKGVRGIWPYQKKLLFLTIVFMISASIVTSLTAKWWLIWLAGEAFREAIVIFRYLTLWVIVSTATVILSVQWIGRGLFFQLSTASLLTGLINIALNMVFIPKYGMMGAVWATMGTALFALCINIGMYVYLELDSKKTD